MHTWIKLLIALSSLQLSGCITYMAQEHRKEPCNRCVVTDTHPVERQKRREANRALTRIALEADIALWSFARDAITAGVRSVARPQPAAEESLEACSDDRIQVCSATDGCWCEGTD